jgi:hypothetical protein
MILENTEGHGSRIVCIAVGAVGEKVFLRQLAGLVDVDTTPELEMGQVLCFKAGNGDTIDRQHTECQPRTRR